MEMRTGERRGLVNEDQQKPVNGSAEQLTKFASVLYIVHVLQNLVLNNDFMFETISLFGGFSEIWIANSA